MILKTFVLHTENNPSKGFLGLCIKYFSPCNTILQKACDTRHILYCPVSGFKWCSAVPLLLKKAACWETFARTWTCILLTRRDTQTASRHNWSMINASLAKLIPASSDDIRDNKSSKSNFQNAQKVYTCWSNTCLKAAHCSWRTPVLQTFTDSLKNHNNDQNAGFDADTRLKLTLTAAEYVWTNPTLFKHQLLNVPAQVQCQLD